MRRFIYVLATMLMVISMNAYAVEVPYIDASTGEWVNVEITDVPPIDDISQALEEVDETQIGLECLGDFKLTYYCPCRKCNGGPAIDLYGDPLVWGTVAVDPKVIPLKTNLKIDGFDAVFTARDTGGKWVQGKHIDVFVPVSHSEALKMAHWEQRTVWRFN